MHKYYKLQDEMKKNKVTQKRMSELLGIHENTIIHKLDGKAEWTIGEIEFMCDFFKKDYYELFGKE